MRLQKKINIYTEINNYNNMYATHCCVYPYLTTKVFRLKKLSPILDRRVTRIRKTYCFVKRCNVQTDRKSRIKNKFRRFTKCT